MIGNDVVNDKELDNGFFSFFFIILRMEFFIDLISSMNFSFSVFIKLCCNSIFSVSGLNFGIVSLSVVSIVSF